MSDSCPLDDNGVSHTNGTNRDALVQLNRSPIKCPGYLVR